MGYVGAYAYAEVIPVIHLSSWVRVLWYPSFTMELHLRLHSGMMRQQKKKALIN